MFLIRDNIHGDIAFDGMFAHIINTPEFQRLRSIEQGSFRPVFPGARHDRFIHSLGTYHLAGKFVEHFFLNIRQDLKARGKSVPTLAAADVKRLKTTFRYAALLHDIGHAPFSHTTEELFAEPIGSTGLPLIWEQLCDEVKAVASAAEYDRFVKSTAKKVGAPHEIASAVLLIRNRSTFLQGEGARDVDLELAARMVIGYTYKSTDVGADPKEAEEKGIRNCLIQLLNSSILDVDRLDYLGRDTMMSGFTNAPLDLECLASSVTAVRMADGWLAPAYRDSALRVFDLMFQAKLSHDAWVLASPAGPYDAGLTAHCIRRLNDLIDPGYTRTIFSIEALGRTGVDMKGKHYRLLSDVDIAADLKAQTDPEFQELYTRELGKRRLPAWRSYYEFQHIFNDPANGITAEAVFNRFKPLLEYMEKEHIFVFNKAGYDTITSRCADKKVTQAADYLRTFLNGLTTDAAKKDAFNVVLLKRKNNFTMGIDPEAVRIVFPAHKVPLRLDERNYSTYRELTGITAENMRSREYFYLYRHGGLGYQQLAKLRKSMKAFLKISL